MADVRRLLGMVVLLAAGCAKGLAGLDDEDAGGGGAGNTGGQIDSGASTGADGSANGSTNNGGQNAGTSSGGASGDGGEDSGAGDAGDGEDSGQCAMDAAGCSRPALFTSIETSEFASSLDSPDRKTASILIMAPSDLTKLVLGIDPLDGLTTLTGTLSGSSGMLGTCAAVSMGGACDFSNLTLGASAGGLLTLSLTNTSGSSLDPLRIRIGGETGGITAPVVFNGTWSDSSGDTNYVLWPVGSATSSLVYAWTDTSFGSFSAVFRSPDGTKVEATDVFGPSTSIYPTDVSKTGWYLFGTSPDEAESYGESYTFTVTAN